MRRNLISALHVPAVPTCTDCKHNVCRMLHDDFIAGMNGTVGEAAVMLAPLLILGTLLKIGATEIEACRAVDGNSGSNRETDQGTMLEVGVTTRGTPLLVGRCNCR